MAQNDITFSIDQIHEAVIRVNTGADFPQLVQDLKMIGVTHYVNYVTDGRTNYYGINGFSLNGNPKYPSMDINGKSSADLLKHAISIHQKGQTDYATFCNDSANAGVEKWITHMLEMTVTYLDKEGNKLIVEPIPQPSAKK